MTSLPDVIADQRSVRLDLPSIALRLLVSSTTPTLNLGKEESVGEPFNWLTYKDWQFFLLLHGSRLAIRAINLWHGSRFRSAAEQDEFLNSLLGTELSAKFMAPRANLGTPEQILGSIVRFIDIDDLLTEIYETGTTLDTTRFNRYERKPRYGAPGLKVRLEKNKDGGWILDARNHLIISNDQILGLLGALTLESHAVAGHMMTALRISEISADVLERGHPLATLLLPTELNARIIAARALVSLFSEGGAFSIVFGWTFKGVQDISQELINRHKRMGPELAWLRRRRESAWIQDIRELVLKSLHKCSGEQRNQARRWASKILEVDRASKTDVEDLATYALASAKRHATWSCDEFTGMLIALTRLDWRRCTVERAYRSVSVSLSTSVEWPKIYQYFPTTAGTVKQLRGIYYGV